MYGALNSGAGYKRCPATLCPGAAGAQAGVRRSFPYTAGHTKAPTP